MKHFNPQRMEIARMRRKMPMRELARSIGVDPVTIGRWKAYLNRPTARQVKSIAAVLDWPLAWFYGEDIDMPERSIL